LRVFPLEKVDPQGGSGKKVAWGWRKSRKGGGQNFPASCLPGTESCPSAHATSVAAALEVPFPLSAYGRAWLDHAERNRQHIVAQRHAVPCGVRFLAPVSLHAVAKCLLRQRPRRETCICGENRGATAGFHPGRLGGRRSTVFLDRRSLPRPGPFFDNLDATPPPIRLPMFFSLLVTAHKLVQRFPKKER
jgi:hypothetical protein